MSKLDTKIKNPTEYQQYILNYLPTYEQWSYTFGAVYKHFHKNGYSTLVFSRNMLNNRQLKYLNNDESNEANKIIDYISRETENKLNIENNVQTSENIKINFGLNLAQANYTNNTFQKFSINNTLDTVIYNTALEIFKYGLFAQSSKGFFNHRLDLSLGIRTDAAIYDKQTANPLKQISPRFSASYTLTEKFSVNFNTGRYFQLPAYTTLGFEDNNNVLINKKNNISYISSDHIIGGVAYQPTSTTRYTLESFIKLYNNYPFSINDSISLANHPTDFGVVGNEAILSTGKGRAVGIEFLAQTIIAKKTNLVISYTFARSEFEDKYGNYKPSSWDNRHILVITTNQKIKKTWNVALKWRFAGGLPYTPYDLERSSYISAWNITNQPYLDFNQVNSKRFHSFHQLDVRIDKTFFMKNSSLKIYIDIQNAYNFKSQEKDRLTNLDINGNKLIDPNNPTKYLLRTIPSAGVGTILPTIGVIFDF